MPFGFWVLGNMSRTGEFQGFNFAVSNAFRLLGSGEPKIGEHEARLKLTRSQMPFGFWVLGNQGLTDAPNSAAASSQMPFGFWVLGNVMLGK